MAIILKSRSYIGLARGTFVNKGVVRVEETLGMILKG